MSPYCVGILCTFTTDSPTLKSWLHRKGQQKAHIWNLLRSCPMYCSLWLIFNLYLFPVIILNCQTNSLQNVVSLSRNHLTWGWFLKLLKLAVVVRSEAGPVEHCVHWIFVIPLTWLCDSGHWTLEMRFAKMTLTHWNLWFVKIEDEMMVGDRKLLTTGWQWGHHFMGSQQ